MKNNVKENHIMKQILKEEKLRNLLKSIKEVNIIDNTENNNNNNIIINNKHNRKTFSRKI